MMAWLRRYGRWLLLLLGVVALFFLIRESGPERVWATLRRATPYLAILLFLEAAWFAFDVLAFRATLGERAKHVSIALWVKSSLTAYAVMILLPAGRAGAEMTRAAMLVKPLGTNAVVAATQFQATTLIANGLISIPCAIAIASEVGLFDVLTLLAVGNGLATAVLGGGILIVSRKTRIGNFFARRFTSIGKYAAEFDERLRDAPFPKQALAIAVFARALQTFQYGVLLLAVGGTLTFASAWIAEGIHLIGAGFGDFVPNAVGITEAAYRIFAGALGLASDPASAIGIALIARLCQLALATAGLVLSGFRFGPADPADPAPVDPGPEAPLEAETPPKPDGAQM